MLCTNPPTLKLVTSTWAAQIAFSSAREVSLELVHCATVWDEQLYAQRISVQLPAHAGCCMSKPVAQSTCDACAMPVGQRDHGTRQPVVGCRVPFR